MHVPEKVFIALLAALVMGVALPAGNPAPAPEPVRVAPPATTPSDCPLRIRPIRAGPTSWLPCGQSSTACGRASACRPIRSAAT